MLPEQNDNQWTYTVQSDLLFLVQRKEVVSAEGDQVREAWHTAREEEEDRRRTREEEEDRSTRER